MPKPTIYINQGGQHRTEDGTLVKKGESFESPDPDLCTKFPNKFVRAADVAANTPVNAGATQSATDTPDNTGDAPDGTQTPATDEGSKDVSGDFDLSGDADGVLSVRKEKGKWNIYEKGDEDPINDKPLAKGKVQAALDEYLAD